MIGVDTSVIVRYLVGSPAAQARRAAALLEGPDRVGIPVVALVETAHVLRTQYGVSRPDLLEVVIDLVARVNVETIGLSKSDTLSALAGARSLPQSPIPDALIAAAARSAGALPLYTFDEDLHRHGTQVAPP